jgi:hypothetical protein
VNAPEVMERAQRHLVREIVPAAARSEQDVMRLGGAVAAPRHLAPALVTIPHLP